ncbi:MAG: DUF2268 domain-containing putative Zn-dependent protease [Candidatus Saccharibacteria bacterium]
MPGVIPEYGTGALTHDTEFIEIHFDAAVPHGRERVLKSLYETPFHEGNHAARWNSVAYDERFIASVTFEGLATVFEREYAHYQPLYGKYEDDDTMREWFAELEQADWDERAVLFFGNPDGRRWIGYKTGAWLIDKAMKNSGKSVIELTGLPHDEIVSLTGMLD